MNIEQVSYFPGIQTNIIFNHVFEFVDENIQQTVSFNTR